MSQSFGIVEEKVREAGLLSGAAAGIEIARLRRKILFQRVRFRSSEHYRCPTSDDVGRWGF